ncbi:MAG: hypothetical protein KIT14_21250 [bacterium]|nr:hypothetical protein [bacterium]
MHERRGRTAVVTGGAERPAALEDLVRSLPPAEVAAAVVDAIRTDRFDILTTHSEPTAHARARMEDLVEGRAPSTAPVLR